MIPAIGGPANLVPLNTQQYALLDDHTVRVSDPMKGSSTFTVSVQEDRLSITYANGSTGTYVAVR